jgi:uncharacterized protein
MASFLSPLLREPEGRYRLVSGRTGQTVADALSTAFDSRTRRTGLLRHASLPLGSALIIAPCNAVHTFFMRFAIDVAFVARDGRVVKVRLALRPWRIAAAWGAFAVIEMAAGAAAASRLVAGDQLSIEPVAV